MTALVRLAAASVLAITVCPVYAQMSGHQHEGGSTAAEMHAHKPPVPPSHAVTVSFQGATKTLTVEDLRALPQTTLHVHNAHANADETYSGPLLSVVLEHAGLAAAKETEPLILHSVVVAGATDHYTVVYSAAEAEPMFSKEQVIVAINKADAPDTAGGVIQLINTGDAKPARWVHGLSSLRVEPVASSDAQ